MRRWLISGAVAAVLLVALVVGLAVALFQALNRRGQTIVLVTHDELVSAHAKRIVRLRDGRKVSDEPVAQPKDAIEQFAEIVGSRRSA